uniref:Uncharacterized protein n=1 Tax=Romanomermis culicivorax TaxID=13658 RepID=A0A915HHQ0_ROMCU
MRLAIHYAACPAFTTTTTTTYFRPIQVARLEQLVARLPRIQKVEDSSPSLSVIFLPRQPPYLAIRKMENGYIANKRERQIGVDGPICAKDPKARKCYFLSYHVT